MTRRHRLAPTYWVNQHKVVVCRYTIGARELCELLTFGALIDSRSTNKKCRYCCVGATWTICFELLSSHVVDRITCENKPKLRANWCRRNSKQISGKTTCWGKIACKQILVFSKQASKGGSLALAWAYNKTHANNWKTAPSIWERKRKVYTQIVDLIN
jgi:hypothetical protein